ncbi:hypothetical protein BAE44_0022499 [Dichanthelium oligosanthes]|uniref:Ycf54-like protein n=1 Tax=Dichanthelium oligosanthes TaxID=888268 RepID=A0A1E5UUG1_9POAL|nr:hypothetical protein BAE44_0022499 [Dichanthelium oligosanthes]
MVAPATLSLRPCAPPALPRTALARSRAWFAPATRASPTASVPARTFSGLRRAVAVDSDQQGSPEPPEQEKKPKTYYFLVANAKFMLDEEEHFQEQLAEKLRNYAERDKERDFWLVVEPKFLDKFPNITKRLKRPAAALVSTDGHWITFMKLRLDRVLQDHFDAESVEEALASNPVDLNFEKPEKWTAPYPKYEFGWWEPFLPPKSSNGAA